MLTTTHASPRAGRRTGRIVLIILVLLVLAIIGGGIAVMTMPGLRARFVPTSSLVERILNAQGADEEAWRILEGRELENEVRLQVLEGLLVKRLRMGFLPPADDRWMAAQLDAGRVPDALVQRYYDEMLEARVLRPNEAVAGRPTMMIVEFHDYVRQLPDRMLVVLVDGLYLGASEQPFGRQDDPVDIKMLPRQRYRTDVFEPAAPGPLETRFVFWHVLGPPEIAEEPIQWQDDGTPVIPPSAIWSRRVVLEHTIDVREGG